MLTCIDICNLIYGDEFHGVAARKHKHLELIILEKHGLKCLVSFSNTDDDSSQELVLTSFDTNMIVSYGKTYYVDEIFEHNILKDSLKEMIFDLAFSNYFSRNVIFPSEQDIVLDRKDEIKVKIDLNHNIIARNILNELLRPLLKSHNRYRGISFNKIIVDNIINIEIFVSSNKDFEKFKRSIGIVSFNMDSLFNSSCNYGLFLDNISFKTCDMEVFTQTFYKNYHIYEEFLFNYRNYFYDKEVNKGY